MKHMHLASALDELESRQNGDGGFSFQHDRSQSRVDATAWAILALRSHGREGASLKKAVVFLRSYQSGDGRMVLSWESPRTVWPTYAVAWALTGVPAAKDVHEKAVSFILQSGGVTQRLQSWQVGHDLSLKGWSWIENTHGWVDPTALALLALRASGYRRHPRYREGVKFLQNRELPSGGWNYGNTVVFGTELRPASESTGMALTVLTPIKKYRQESQDYLRSFIHDKSGSLTLAWALMAMGKADDLDCLDRNLGAQKEKGYCQTEWLSLLCVAWSVLVGQPQAGILGFSVKGDR